MGDSKPEPPKVVEPTLNNSVETKIALENDAELENRYYEGIKNRNDIYDSLSEMDRRRLTLLLARGKLEKASQLKTVAEEYETALKTREAAFVDALSSDSSGKRDEEKKKAIGLQTSELINTIKEGGDLKRMKLLDNVMNTVVAYSESKQREVKAYESKLRELQGSAARDSTRSNLEAIRNNFASRPDEKFVLPPFDNTPKTQSTQAIPTPTQDSTPPATQGEPNPRKRNYNEVSLEDPVFSTLTKMLNSAPGNFKA